MGSEGNDLDLQRERANYLIERKMWKELVRLEEAAVGPLIQALKNKDRDVRMAAAGILGEIGNKMAVEPLIKALKDEDKDVRKVIVKVLGKIGDIRAVEPLIHALKNEDWIVRQYIVMSLGRMGKQAVEPLIEAFKDEDLKVRTGAAKALGEIGDKRAVETLLRAMKEDLSDVRMEAAEALEKIGWEPKNEKDEIFFLFAIKQWKELKNLGKAAEELLTKAMNDDKDPTVRRGAGRTLGRPDWNFGTLTLDKSFWNLSVDKEKDNDIIVKDRWFDLGKGDYVRLGEMTVENLFKAIKSVDFTMDDAIVVWQELIEALGAKGDLGAIEFLTQLLKENRHDYYKVAVILRALCDIRDKRVVKPLIDGVYYIVGDSSGRIFDEFTYLKVIETLGELRDTRAMDFLIGNLGSNYEEVRREARLALVKIGKPAIKPLIRELDEKWDNWRLREEAARIFGEIQDIRAIESLIGFLGDEGVTIRKEAVLALKKFGEAAIEPIIQALSDEYVRDNIIEVLTKMREPAIKSLIRALKDEDPNIRVGAVLVLREMRAKEAIEPLMRLLQDNVEFLRSEVAYTLDILGWKPKNDAEKAYYLIANEDWDEIGELGEDAVEPLNWAFQDEDDYIRHDAAFALGKRGDLKAIEYLIKELKHRRIDFRNKAAEALGEIGNIRAVEPLIEALKSENKDDQLYAAEALGKIGDIRALGPLLEALRDINSRARFSVANALDKLGWKPENEKEKIYYLIAKGDWDELVRIGRPTIELLN
jgi:HEAT repeat protein